MTNFIITGALISGFVLLLSSVSFVNSYGDGDTWKNHNDADASTGPHFTDGLVFRPNIPANSRIEVITPDYFDLPFETVVIHTADRVKLHGYLIKHEENKNKSQNFPTLIFFHGNAGNIGHRLEEVKSHYENSNTKYNTLLVEYRGFGYSEGIPSENGLYLDAQAALDFVIERKDLDSSKIIVFGRSLGGAIAIDLASRPANRDKILALIVENTFTSIPALVEQLYPYPTVSWIASNLFWKNRFDSLNKIKSVTSPTLFISGLKDDLIPPGMMNELFRKCSSRIKRLKRFPLGSHMDTWQDKNYEQEISAFITEVLTRPKVFNFSLPILTRNTNRRRILRPRTGQNQNQQFRGNWRPQIIPL